MIEYRILQMFGYKLDLCLLASEAELVIQHVRLFKYLFCSLISVRRLPSSILRFSVLFISTYSYLYLHQFCANYVNSLVNIFSS